MKLLALITIGFLPAGLIAAQSYSISGKYVDGKGNAIGGASVELIEGGMMIGPAMTASDGTWAIDVVVTGINDMAPNHQLSVYPNPFAGSVNIIGSSRSVGNLKIMDLGGRIIGELETPSEGFHIEWGGYLNN